MNIVEDKVIDELRKKYNRGERIIKIMIEECKNMGLSIEKSRQLILEFLKKEQFKYVLFCSILCLYYGQVDTFLVKIRDFQFLESLDIIGWTGQIIILYKY